MKRIGTDSLIIFISLMLLISVFMCAGCNKIEVHHGESLPDDNSSDPSHAPIANIDTNSLENALMNSVDSRATVCGDVVFFADPGKHSRLCYLDMTTGESMILCAKPDCTHTGADCNAYIGNAKNLMTDGSRLFWSEKILSSNEWKLYSMNTDGTDRRAEAELDHNKLDAVGDTGTAGIFNNKLFMCLCRSGILEGKSVYSTMIFSHDLKSNSEEILFEETGSRNCLGGIIDDKLYFVLFDAESVTFNCCDMSSGIITELHKDEMPVYASEPLQMYFSGGILLLMGSFDCWAYDIANDRFFALRQWTEDPSGETSVAFCTSDRILLYCGMKNYRFEDMNGNILSEGVIEAEGFNESAFTKEPIGCVDGKILLRFESMDDDETPYLLSFNTETCEWKTEWSGTAD